jgi:lipopolysaccharide export system permease protein
MKIIDRYIFIQFLQLFAATMAVLLTLFILVTFFDLINDFLDSNAKFSQVVYYFLLKLPEAAFFMTPMAVLISSILTFSIISRNREVVIMMSCGLSAFRIVLPVLAAALAISFLSFLNGDLVLPKSWKKSQQIYYRDIKKTPYVSSHRQDRIWIKTDRGAIWNIAHMDAAAGIIFDVTVVEFSPDRSHFSSVVTAGTAYIENGKWIFEKGIVRRFDGEGRFKEEPFSKKSFGYAVDFATLKRSEKRPEEMNFKEIRAYIVRLRSAGYDDTRYLVDMYVKITFPLICIVMAFIAVPFGLKTERAGGLLAGITSSVLLGFVFWFLFSIGVSLGHNGKLPPLLASTGAHLLFLMFAGYKMITQYYLPSGLRRSG